MLKMKHRKIPTIRHTLIRNVVMIVILLTFSVTLIGSLMFYNSMLQQSISTSISALTAMSDSIDAGLRQLEFGASLLATDHGMQDDLQLYFQLNAKNRKNTSQPQYELNNSILQRLQKVSSLFPIYAMGIYYHADNNIQYFSNIVLHELYELASVADAVELVRAAPDSFQYSSVFCIWKSQRYFAVVRSIGDQRTLHPFAELALIINATSISNWISQDSINAFSSFCLLDQAGIPLYNYGSQGLSDAIQKRYTSMLSKETSGRLDSIQGHQLLYVRMQNAPWTLAATISPSTLMRSTMAAVFILPLVGLLCAILAILMINRTSHHIIEPLHRVIQDSERVAEGELIETMPSHDFIETDEVSQNLNRTVGKLRENLDTIYKKEIKQRETEFYSLQAQINPHFLYNTLDTINLMLLVRQEYDISELIVDLAEILRFHVSKGKTIISLRDELSMTEKYLHIMEYRFNGRLHHQLDCTPDSLDCKVAKLLVQPLVENAILHGIEGTNKQCTVTIRSYIRNNNLFIEVHDDGVGIDPEAAVSITNGTYHKQYSTHSGVGLRNIFQRIKLFYGPEYGLSIAPSESGGTDVELRIPADAKEDEHETPVG